MAIPIHKECNDDPVFDSISEIKCDFTVVLRGIANRRSELKGYTVKLHICCDPESTFEEETQWEIMRKTKRKWIFESLRLFWMMKTSLLHRECNEQIHMHECDQIMSTDHDQEGCLKSIGQKKFYQCRHCCPSHPSEKVDIYDLHTDNRNHRCNCRICMNSLLRFTLASANEVVFVLPHAAGRKNLKELSEFRDVLSLFCDVDILLVCLRGMGGIIHPFASLWMSKTSILSERYDDSVLNPLRQTSILSILEHRKLSILDCFEQNYSKCEAVLKRKLYRLSLLQSCFLQITKEVEHYSSKDPMICQVFQTLNTFYLGSVFSVLIVSVIGKLMAKFFVKDMKNRSASSPRQKYFMRKEKVRHYVKEFFLEQEEVSSFNHLKDSGTEPKNVASKQNKHDEGNNSVDEHYRENFVDIFDHVEVRPVEILAYPATQQPVLEPILSKFSVPESAPSKHDTMAVEFLRLCTMHDYPNTNGPSLLRLAQAGFFYEGNGNELVCFSCDFRKGSWNFNDSPREIHQRMSPNCKFLSQGGDGNVPVPREESMQDLVPLQSIPQAGVVEPDGPRVANTSTSNNTAHLASANYSDGLDQPEVPRRTMAVKHPEYAGRPARLASYANFPRHMKQHPADMTDAGFYYAGFGDCCRCYHCGIGLRNWDPEDNPWIEHARWSEECPYILKIKGQAFIDLVQEAARAAEMAQDDEDSEAEGESAATDSDSGNKEKSGASNSSSGGPAADEIENNVAKTSEATMSKGTSDDSGFGSGSAPVAQPIKAPLRTAAAQSLIHDEKIKPKYVTAAIDDLVKAAGWGAFSKENIRKYLKIHEENRKSASSASSADPNSLKQENKELKDLTICKICLDEKVSIVFLPCGHLVSCPQCAPALTKCPICRKSIKGTVRTNLVEKSTAK